MEQYILKQFWKDLVLVGDLEMEFEDFKEQFKQYEPIENETKMVRVASDDDLDEVYYEEEPVGD